MLHRMSRNTAGITQKQMVLQNCWTTGSVWVADQQRQSMHIVIAHYTFMLHEWIICSNAAYLSTIDILLLQYKNIYKSWFLKKKNTWYVTFILQRWRCCVRHQQSSLEHQRGDHLIRMHLTGEPSEPTNRRGKQCSMYIPVLMLSSFRNSTKMISWQKKVSEQSNQMLYPKEIIRKDTLEPTLRPSLATKFF